MNRSTSVDNDGQQVSDEPSLEEYQAQLEEVNALILESPNEESLLQLRSDLLELIQLSTLPSFQAFIPPADNQDLFESSTLTIDASFVQKDSFNITKRASSSVAATAATAAANHTKTNPKDVLVSTSSTFEIPSHLTPLPSDTEAERQKKRRAIKALKSKFKSKQKTVESEVKQKNWQEFIQKKNKKKIGVGGGWNSLSSTGGISHGKSSIFQTEDGIDSKVGVIRGPSNTGMSNSNSRT